MITADAIGGPGSGKIRRLERRLLFVTSRLSDPSVKMSDGVRNHMVDEREALEWALPILRRYVCYEIDSNEISKIRLDSPDSLEDKAMNLDVLACRLRDKARRVRERMEELEVTSLDEILHTTDDKEGSPV